MTVAVALAKARAQDRAALAGYLPAGFPTVEQAKVAVRAMAQAGADLVEIGFPYSDPVMDGPVIARASEIALERGLRPRDVLATVTAAADTGVPVLVMTYWNLIERYGVDAFARDLAAAGGSGLITADLIPDEAGEWIEIADARGLDRVFLVAPSSTDARLARTVAACRGFVYATSVMGVTGAREQTSSAAPALVERARAVAGSLPVGVGLGVRDGAQAAQVGAYADVVIVGSALVGCLLDAPDLPAGLAALGTLTADLAAGVRQSRPGPAGS